MKNRSHEHELFRKKKDFFEKKHRTKNQIRHKQISNDQMPNNQISNNQISNNQISNNQISNNQISNQLITKDLLYKIESYDFKLPDELIAQYPHEKRTDARLMVVDKKGSIIREATFASIDEFLHRDDILILNDTKVIKSRLYCKRISDNRITEVMIIEKIDSYRFKALMRNKKRFYCNDVLIPIDMRNFKADKNVQNCDAIKIGEKIDGKNGKNSAKKQSILGTMAQLPVFNDILLTIDETVDDHIIVSCNKALTFQDFNRIGSMPIPPYINRMAEQQDDAYYQTVFAHNPGSMAAPTAGLHFTKELLERIRAKASFEFVTLHAGWGTFNPIRANNIKHHVMHAEHYVITEKAVKAIESARKKNGRVIACGTTTLRALEGNVKKNGRLLPGEFSTDIFIYPGYRFKVVDSLITNFHTPKSSLLVLVSAFAGYENVRKYYEHAVKGNYEFFSYGDGMMIF